MAQISNATLTLLVVLTVGMLCQQAAAYRCCRRYSKGVLPFAVIRGYSVQTIKTNCNINAVIFHTSMGRNVCADPSQTWVMNSVGRLRDKVQALKRQQQNLQ